jgi:hypothetical protein
MDKFVSKNPKCLPNSPSAGASHWHIHQIKAVRLHMPQELQALDTAFRVRRRSRELLPKVDTTTITTTTAATTAATTGGDNSNNNINNSSISKERLLPGSWHGSPAAARRRRFIRERDCRSSTPPKRRHRSKNRRSAEISRPEEDNNNNNKDSPNVLGFSPELSKEAGNDETYATTTTTAAAAAADLTEEDRGRRSRLPRSRSSDRTLLNKKGEAHNTTPPTQSASNSTTTQDIATMRSRSRTRLAVLSNALKTLEMATIVKVVVEVVEEPSVSSSLSSTGAVVVPTKRAEKPPPPPPGGGIKRSSLRRPNNCHSDVAMTTRTRLEEGNSYKALAANEVVAQFRARSRERAALQRAAAAAAAMTMDGKDSTLPDLLLVEPDKKQISRRRVSSPDNFPPDSGDLADIRLQDLALSVSGGTQRQRRARSNERAKQRQRDDGPLVPRPDNDTTSTGAIHTRRSRSRSKEPKKSTSSRRLSSEDVTINELLDLLKSPIFRPDSRERGTQLSQQQLDTTTDGAEHGEEGGVPAITETRKKSRSRSSSNERPTECRGDSKQRPMRRLKSADDLLLGGSIQPMANELAPTQSNSRPSHSRSLRRLKHCNELAAGSQEILVGGDLEGVGSEKTVAEDVPEAGIVQQMANEPSNSKSSSHPSHPHSMRRLKHANESLAGAEENIIQGVSEGVGSERTGAEDLPVGQARRRSDTTQPGSMRRLKHFNESSTGLQEMETRGVLEEGPEKSSAAEQHGTKSQSGSKGGTKRSSRRHSKVDDDPLADGEIRVYDIPSPDVLTEDSETTNTPKRRTRSQEVAQRRLSKDSRKRSTNQNESAKTGDGSIPGGDYGMDRGHRRNSRSRSTSAGSRSRRRLKSETSDDEAFEELWKDVEKFPPKRMSGMDFGAPTSTVGSCESVFLEMEDSLGEEHQQSYLQLNIGLTSAPMEEHPKEVGQGRKTGLAMLASQGLQKSLRLLMSSHDYDPAPPQPSGDSTDSKSEEICNATARNTKEVAAPPTSTSCKEASANSVTPQAKTPGKDAGKNSKTKRSRLAKIQNVLNSSFLNSSMWNFDTAEDDSKAVAASSRTVEEQNYKDRSQDEKSKPRFTIRDTMMNQKQICERHGIEEHSDELPFGGDDVVNVRQEPLAQPASSRKIRYSNTNNGPLGEQAESVLEVTEEFCNCGEKT